MGILALFAYSEDALVVIPDYEGYGATHGSPHPYLDRDVTAHQVIEGAKAGVAFFAYYVGEYVNDILYDAWESGETWETGSYF